MPEQLRPESKDRGEAATRALNPEPNESKVKRGCEEMRIHFFTAPFFRAGRDRPQTSHPSLNQHGKEGGEDDGENTGDND